MRVVMKFGGTSVEDGDRIRRVARLVKASAKENQVVVVCSAIDGVTDELFSLASRAEKGDEEAVERALASLQERHAAVLADAVRSGRVRRQTSALLSPSLEELKKLARGASVVREVTPRLRDSILSCGERLSNPVVWGALTEAGVDAAYMTGAECGIMTDEAFGDAAPLMEMTRFQVRGTLQPLLEAGRTPVVTGYIASTQSGETTTLGRGGSDLTATIIASSVDADEVWIWSDVDGLMTADPKIVGEARVLPEVSYAEAAEMAVFGAKALHPRTLEPVAEAGITVRFKNALNPGHPGTVVLGAPTVNPSTVVKSVALIRGIALITVAGASMVGKPGSAARVFGILAGDGVNVLMISQSVSESNISVVVNRDSLQRAVNALETAMLGRGGLKSVQYEDDVSAVAVIGGGMRGTRGIAAKVFRAIAAKGINVRMIAQGSSEQNISLVVQERDGEQAVRAVHSAFRLDRS